MADARGLDVVEHIDELRAGLLRSVLYVAIGFAISWKYRDKLMAWLEYPAYEGAGRAGLDDFSFHIFEPAGGIMLMMQVALLGGVVLAFAGIVAEGWKFVSPGMTRRERGYVYLVIPSSVVLFAGGIWFCYVVTPQAFAFLIMFNTQLGVEPEFILGSYLRFFMRLLLVFGLAFQMPLVMMFLGRVGLVSAATFARSWRWAVVIILVIAAIVTPTPDPFNMMLLAGPMILLYFLSLGLVLIMELPVSRSRKRDRARQDEQCKGRGDK
jgi:sec-independent protein translocase protein TatC